MAEGGGGAAQVTLRTSNFSTPQTATWTVIYQSPACPTDELIYKSLIYKSLTYKSMTYKSLTYKSLICKSLIYKSPHKPLGFPDMSGRMYRHI